MPEKNLYEIPRSLREQYEKGIAALQRDNLEYAIAIFNQVLSSEPAFYDCREALRATQHKKTKSQGGLFKRLMGTASSSPLLAKAQISLRNDPADALRTAEQILNGDPQNASAHRLVADAALALGLPKTAALSLEIVHKHAPGQKEVGLKLGQALIQSRQNAKAEAVLSELARAHPQDPDIAMALKNASASRTMSEGGYDKLASGTGSYRDILRDQSQAATLELEQRAIKTEDGVERLIQEYAARLVQEPNNFRLLRSLAELHAQRNEFDRALDYYRRITGLEGGVDPSLDKTIAETVARRYDYEKSKLDSGAPDYAEQAQRLDDAKQEFLLQECRRRAEKYPADLQIRFDLGLLCFQSGKIAEAIQELQKAQANPHRRTAALALLGQCFARRNMHDLAVRSFQNALKEKDVFDDEKKELTYLLGVSLSALGRQDESIEQFKIIYEIDIGFRDVAARVDAYYASK